MGGKTKDEREIRMELLRPGQLNAERERCPLVFVPIGPLEYHGPHLPVGMDPVNATRCALEACQRLGLGVVHPTLYWGTERERPDWMLESLGFEKGDWIVGMDFPAAIWKSHYYPEEVFALVVSQALQMLIRTGYRVIVLVNGHGASNQLETLERMAQHYSHGTEARVVWMLALPVDVTEKNMAGHADLSETSLMMYYQQEHFLREDLVDLGELPGREVPIRYPDFSIVDGPGFSDQPSPGRVVQTDPRDATAAKGEKVFEDTVAMCLDLARQTLRDKGLA